MYNFFLFVHCTSNELHFFGVGTLVRKNGGVLPKGFKILRHIKVLIHWGVWPILYVIFLVFDKHVLSNLVFQ